MINADAKNKRKTSMDGWTLIETALVLVIAAVVVSIAIPGYLAHVRASRREDARATLLDFAHREARYYESAGKYADSPAQLGVAQGETKFPVSTSEGFYQIHVLIESDPALGFTLLATPALGMGQELDIQCATFKLDHVGRRSAIDSAKRDSTSVCWH